MPNLGPVASTTYVALPVTFGLLVLINESVILVPPKLLLVVPLTLLTFLVVQVKVEVGTLAELKAILVFVLLQYSKNPEAGVAVMLGASPIVMVSVLVLILLVLLVTVKVIV